MIFRFYNSIAQLLRASISSPFVIYLSIYLSIHPSIYSFIIFLSLVRPHPHDASIIRRNNLRRHHDANEDSLGLKRPLLTVVINSLCIFYYWPCTVALSFNVGHVFRGRVSGFSLRRRVYLYNNRPTLIRRPVIQRRVLITLDINLHATRVIL